MIICASRRTDIPAFHADWFMNRLHAGYVLVRNPVLKTVVYNVDLRCSNVDCLVFITKDPRPMVPYLKELSSMGYMYTFQVTMTPYGKDIEPGMPLKADIADAFKQISNRIGSDRMIWRYDPVIFNDIMDINYHKRKFELFCKELEGYTQKCTFSFIDMYSKLGKQTDVLRSVTDVEMDTMGKMMSEIASKYGISLGYCCADYDLSEYGIESRGCIDRADMTRLGVPFEDMSTLLRAGCRCVKNIDVGAYDTCNHDCIYCYANRNASYARKNKEYDPRSEILWGKVSEDDRIINLPSRNVSRIDDFRVF